MVTVGSFSATTNSAGLFSISGLANGVYTVTPTLSGYTFIPASLSVTVNSAPVTGVDFIAERTLTIMQDGNGHTWVETDFYRIDISHGSEFLIKNPVPVDWRAYYPTTYNWLVALGNNSNAGFASAGTWDVAGAGVNNLGSARISSNATTATATFSQTLSTTYPIPSPTFEINPTFTFYSGAPVIKVTVPPITNVLSSPYPNAYEFYFTLTPGGNADSDDYYYFSGMNDSAQYPYGSALWPINSSQMATVGNGYVYICEFDTSARQGIAYIMAKTETADFDTDTNFGIADVRDDTYYGHFSHIDLSGNASIGTTWYMYIFAPDSTTPWKPVEDFIKNQIAGYES